MESFSKFLRNLQVIHLAIIAGIVVFALAGFVNMHSEAANAQSSFISYLRLVIAGLLLAVWILIHFVLSKGQAALAKLTIEERMNKVRRLHIVRLALLEIPALLALVGFYLASDLLCLAYAGMAVLLMAIDFPTRNKMLNTLTTSEEERHRLEDEAGE